MNKPYTEMGKFWAENKHRAAVVYSTYRVRVQKMYMSYEEALTTEHLRGAITDDVYKKWSKIAQKNGINYRVFHARVRKYGWSYEKAAHEPTRAKKKNGQKTPYKDADALITKESDKEVKQMVQKMIESNAPVPKKYIKRFPELFKGGA